MKIEQQKKEYQQNFNNFYNFFRLQIAGYMWDYVLFSVNKNVFSSYCYHYPISNSLALNNPSSSRNCRSGKLSFEYLKNGTFWILLNETHWMMVKGMDSMKPALDNWISSIYVHLKRTYKDQMVQAHQSTRWNWRLSSCRFLYSQLLTQH